MYFNKQYRRCGHLFQDRFKSEVVDNDGYLVELSRYIHLNPVRAQIVSNATDYRWSSYGTYIGIVKDYRKLIDTTLVLKLISNDIRRARQEYIEYVSRNDFVHDKCVDIRIPIDYSDLENDFLPEIYDPEWVQELITKIAKENGIEESDITKKKTNYIIPRNNAINEVRKHTNLSLREIGDLFGGLSESAVSKILKK